MQVVFSHFGHISLEIIHIGFWLDKSGRSAHIILLILKCFSRLDGPVFSVDFGTYSRMDLLPIEARLLSSIPQRTSLLQSDKSIFLRHGKPMRLSVLIVVPWQIRNVVIFAQTRHLIRCHPHLLKSLRSQRRFLGCRLSRAERLAPRACADNIVVRRYGLL